MDRKLFEWNDLQIWQRGHRYFARYDAGAHQVVMREDEISEDEARRAMIGGADTTEVLRSLQKRLETTGIDPYTSNTK